MEQFYTNERNVLIVVALLKAHGIKKVVVSPGSTNVTFVGSIQQDSFFEIYSCVDERSAGYIACGLAAESGEVVALSCTGATASRNYFSALTEAYYRKLPILAITSTQDEMKIGHLVPQVIDRSVQPKDIVKCSVHLQTVKDDDDAWDCMIKANKAILALNHHGTGPVHINLTTTYSRDFSVKTLPYVRKIERVYMDDAFPAIPDSAKVAIYVGTHLKWSEEEIDAIDKFCSYHNAVVFTDPASNYNGYYRVSYLLVAQQKIKDDNLNPDILIHIGNMSDMAGVIKNPQEVWRVSEDGEIQDRYKKLKYIFEMKEKTFFKYYSKTGTKKDDSYLQSCKDSISRVENKMPKLPFSHLWVASILHDKLPQNSVLHLGILSPLRSWGYFNIPSDIEVFCNQGGFGIDGNMSTLLGASQIKKDKIYFGIVGDLSFFYDMNSLGNRHLGANIRILLINNSLGAEFLLFKQLNSTYVNNVDKYISAGGHFGKKSLTVVKHLAEDWGFEYLSAWNKDDFNNVYKRFITPEITDRPMILEVFTEVEKENDALFQIYNIEITAKGKIRDKLIGLLGEKTFNTINDKLR